MRITVVSKATGIYVDYWKRLVGSSKILASDYNLRFVCFSDNAHLKSESTENHETKIVKVTPLGWPGDSLNRYSLYYENLDLITRETDLVLHLDADMLFRGPFDQSDIANIFSEGIGLVQHPSFPKEPKRLKPRAKTLRKNLGNRWHLRHRGSWETRKQSSAYTPRRHRLTYVAGGVWFSTPSRIEAFLKGVLTLIQQDEQRSYIATWHDESYLNKWFSIHRKETYLLPKSYCYAGNHPGIPKIIEAVEKGDRRTR